MELSAKQLDLARHALGLVNRNRRSYRNHYVGEESACREMVAMGAARAWEPSEITGGMPLFRLARAGAEAALRPGETLDPEGFPKIAAAGAEGGQ